MRSYILTDRERTFIESFIGTQEINEEDYQTYCQIRHHFRKHEKTLTWDLELLKSFMNTTRKPKCGVTVK